LIKDIKNGLKGDLSIPDLDDKAALRASSDDFQVSVFVGPEKAHFLLPKTWLCAQSTYFNSAFTGGLKDSQDNSMNLSKEDEDTFTLFMQWALFGKIEPTLHKRKDEAWSYRQGRIKHAGLYAKLCVFYG